MPVGELILGAFLSMLFDRLTSPELLQFATREGIKSELKKWEKTLKFIDDLLVDAEEKQLTEKAVQTWLDDLQDLAYDVEDILDEFATEALGRTLKAEDRASTSKVRNLIPPCFTGCTPSAFKFNTSMRSKIDAISSRLEELREQRTGLGLQKISGGTSTAVSRRPDSTSVQPEPAVYGRDEDRANILKMVLNDEPSNVNFVVITIVGMGGLGKTTLARQVFNDDAVKLFYPRAWVCISDDFDVFKISKALLESITSKSSDLKNLNEVQVQLRNEVAGKKFLLVLDDVWSDKYDLWESLRSPFLAGAPGSKIIVTTRIKDVALTIGHHSDCYELKLLTKEACWDIFKTHVSGNRVFAESRNLKLYKEKVIERCRGLPLAARSLGGLLRTKERDDEWEDILNSKIWDLSTDIPPVLKLSYHHLPSHLKRCFAYCAVFPKDYEFEEQELILLWLAEGLIQQTKNKLLEELGREYFHDLLSRSILQQSAGNVSKFVMHDLVNDLAQSISRDTSFFLEDQLSLQLERLERIRHSSFICKEYEVKDRFKVFHRVDHLRTFLPLLTSASRYSGTNYVVNTVFPDLLLKLKKLRVLSLVNYSITELPNSIGGLTHLRYLDLSFTKIRRLPESICSLYNLQVLKLKSCTCLEKLPFNMENLINLRYLDISESSLIREMPLGMGELKCLRTLSNFIVGKDTGSSLKELRELKFLCGKLVISSLENMLDSLDTRGTILSDKKYLEVLVLKWGSNFNSSREVIREENVLKMLQPHENLKELTIENYGGKIFPHWVGDKSFSKLVVLQLNGCENCITLPSLVLLGSLKNLTIKNMKNVNKIGSEICGRDCSKSFASLETLCFEDLPEWEHWDPIEENGHIEKFPHLQELSISKCPKLCGRLPNRLPLLEKLVIDKCDQLVVSFSSLPKLRLLEINRCKGMVCCNPIGSKSINLETRENLNFPVFKNWSSQGFQKIESLRIVGCNELVHLWPIEIRLEKPPQGLENFTSLQELHLEELRNLASVPTGFFSILSTLKIRNCNGLTSLHGGLKHSNPCLQHLEIEGCDSLICIVKGQLPSSLKKLDIRDCRKLLCVLDGIEDACSTLSPSSCSSSSVVHKEDVNNSRTSLYLYIRNCPSLTFLSSVDLPLPATLVSLQIWRCSNIKSLLSRGQLPKALKILFIFGCSNLEPIVERFDNNSSLVSFSVGSCANLKSIPEGLHSLGSLSEFVVCDCPSLIGFPEGGLPNTPNLSFSLCDCGKVQALPKGVHGLTSLSVGNLNLYEHLKQQGFDKFTSLEELCIYACPDVSFPQEDMGMKLPTSLTSLEIFESPKLKYLSSLGFQNLSSLRSLKTFDCKNLTSLSSLPSSLEELYIQFCPNVTSLPTLPSSLLLLVIDNCPMLKKQCKRDEGKEWSKLSHIPCVLIDWKFIYDLEEEDWKNELHPLSDAE